MTLADPSPRITVWYRRLLAIATVCVLVILGSTAAVALSTRAAADERARAEVAAAEEVDERLIDYYRGALERLQPVGSQLVEDATALAASASPLLTTIDVSSLQSTADAVSGSFAGTPLPNATRAELADLFDSRWDMIGGARERLGAFVASAAAAAQVHRDAAPIASAASRQAVVDAIAALGLALADHTSIAAPFTALTAAVAAVDQSQAAAAAAQAAAAARRGGGTRPGEPACASDVLSCVNQIRSFYGLGSLSSNGTLNSAAQSCAQRMHDSGEMTHSSPTPGFSRWGENIAQGYGSQVSVFNAWMNSAGHRANILNANYTSMGFGYVSDGNWWCQQFGG
jgi:uncharacterized protein YkwD